MLYSKIKLTQEKSSFCTESFLLLIYNENHEEPRLNIGLHDYLFLSLLFSSEFWYFDFTVCNFLSDILLLHLILLVELLRVNLQVQYHRQQDRKLLLHRQGIHL